MMNEGKIMWQKSLQFHWPGRGSGGSMSATRPFGQPLVLSRQESPSTSSPRPMERFYRAANKKRWPVKWRRNYVPRLGEEKDGIYLGNKKFRLVLFIYRLRRQVLKTAKRDGRGNVSRSWELIKIDQVKLLVRITKVENSVEKFLIKTCIVYRELCDVRMEVSV